MTQSIRQSELFAAEDWKKIYQAFTQINFNAYDFDSIRAAMIDYIQKNYPEDFNDWVESSDLIAIIDLLAYLGTSLAFRMDLNTRENFIDNAERKESILKLARLLSYKPRRNIPSRGLVKIVSVETNDDIVDSSGKNLNGAAIQWNDANNPDWFEQFILILNNSFISINPFGQPIKSGNVGNIRTQLYQFNNIAVNAGSFEFNANVDGLNLNFELVNGDFDIGGTFIEKSPNPAASYHLIYRNDGRGNSSKDTGFFLFFKQGSLQFQDFNIVNTIENRVLDINANNINELDVWVQSIDDNGLVTQEWTKVPSTFSNNVIYNSIDKNIRNIYEVITRDNDQISIRFGDNRFGSIPSGLIRVWYRVSANETYDIRPQDMSNVELNIPYINLRGQQKNLKLIMSLQETITNASTSETLEEIRFNAPRVYYTQDRMVNGEDYNVFPLTNSQAIKIKAINRSYAGHSRFIDLNDPTGTIQNNIVFADDGILFENPLRGYNEIVINDNLTSDDIITGYIQPRLESEEVKTFLLKKLMNNGSSLYKPWSLTNLRWYRSSNSSYSSTGYFFDSSINIKTMTHSGVDISTNTFSLTSHGYVNNQGIRFSTTGTLPSPLIQDHIYYVIVIDNDNFKISLTPSGPELNILTTGNGTFNILISPPAGTQLPQSSTMTSAIDTLQEGTMINFNSAGWVSIITIEDSGDGENTSGRGKITLSEPVNTNDYIVSVIPPLRTSLTQTEYDEIKTLLDSLTPAQFGIYFNWKTQTWKTYLTTEDLNSSNDDNFVFYGDITNPTTSNEINGWVMYVCNENDSVRLWTLRNRGLQRVYESLQSVRFYYFNTQSIVDPRSGRSVKDNIKVLSINPLPDQTGTTGNNKLFNWIDYTQTTSALQKNFDWSLISQYLYSDGYSEPRRVVVVPNDSDSDGMPDDPDAFEKIVTDGFTGNYTYVFWESYLDQWGYQYYRPKLDVEIRYGDLTNTSNLYPVSARSLVLGDVVFRYENIGTINPVFYKVIQTPTTSIGINDTEYFEPVTDDSYIYRLGRAKLRFQWNHYAPLDNRIDPAVSSLIDVFVLDRSYDTELRRWVNNNDTIENLPVPPSPQQLKIDFAEIEANKMLTDQIIWRPVTYKLLFGQRSNAEYRAKFKVVKVDGTTLSDGEIKSRVIAAINDYFAVNNWDFGETFYFTEMAAYIHSRLVTSIASITIVPTSNEARFGNLFQIKAEPNEILISAATVNDVEIISNLNNVNLRIGS